MQWKKIFALYLFQYALPHIRKTSGCVINDSSLVGKLGQDGSVTYVATKVSLSHRAPSGKCDCKLKLSIFKHIYQTHIKDECLAYFLRKCAKLDCDIIHAVFSFINQKAKITSMKHGSTKSLVQNKAIWEVNMNWKTWLNMYLKYKLKKKINKIPLRHTKLTDQLSSRTTFWKLDRRMGDKWSTHGLKHRNEKQLPGLGYLTSFPALVESANLIFILKRSLSSYCWDHYLHTLPCSQVSETHSQFGYPWGVLSWYDLQTLDIKSWVSCQIRKTAGCACVGNAGNVFPATAG